MTDAPLWTLGPFIGLVFVAALSGAVFKPDQWYRDLDKPGWTPPDWVFPVVWTVLYVAMAYAAWRVWDIAGLGLAMVAWGVQLALNAGWSAVFFGMRRLDLALLEAFSLWIAVAFTLYAFGLVDVLAAALFVPYLAWVTLATLLNLSILRRQRARPA